MPSICPYVICLPYALCVIKLPSYGFHHVPFKEIYQENVAVLQLWTFCNEERSDSGAANEERREKKKGRWWLALSAAFNCWVCFTQL